MAMNSTGGGRRPLSLLVWAVLVTVLTAAAYLTGASMARTWIAPPQLQETPAPTETPSQVVPTARLTPDDPVEGILDAESGDEWVFGGKAGQAATLEMWFHPGSGSNMEAELIIHLSGPDGTSLANEPGSMFLPPYAHEVSLPATGPYRVQVVPISGAPGRYSLLLTLSAASVPGTLGATLPPQTPQPAPSSDVTVPAQATFQWPTPRRAISGWTFHDPRNPGHIGLDIAASMWDPIVAVADGVVVFAEWGGRLRQSGHRRTRGQLAYLLRSSDRNRGRDGDGSPARRTPWRGRHNRVFHGDTSAFRDTLQGSAS